MALALPTFAAHSLQTIATLVSGGIAGTAALGISFRRHPRHPHSGNAAVPFVVAATMFTPGEHAALDAPMAFVERLATLPLDTWMRVGETAMRRRPETVADSTARVHALLSDQRLNVAAWIVRDGIDTAVFYAASAGPRLSRTDRRTFAAAHSAAEDMALALLVRVWLPTVDLATLTVPFTGLVPVPS